MNPRITILSGGKVICEYKDKAWLGTFGTDGSIVWERAKDGEINANN